MVCQVTCRILQDAGYTAEAVYSARVALAYASPDRPYDLFILDVRLPEMSGLALPHLITPRYPGAPFLFISGFPDLHGDEPPTALWEFLPKPFDAEHLLAAVHRLLFPDPPSEGQ